LLISSQTQASQYKSRIAGLYSHALEVFAKDTAGVFEESACAPQNSCNNDSQAFRAILARALANAEALTPSVNLTSKAAGTLTSVIDKSAAGAAAQCSGGKNGTTCGSDWSTSKWDGTQGLGQDLSALEMILAAMPGKPTAVRTENGTSTTNHSGSSTTSSGTTATNTNDARRQGASIAVLAATVIFAYFACA
jgi:mannan endo-1,6-alpha-mannosidase